MNTLDQIIHVVSHLTWLTNEVMKTLTARNSTIVMASSKKFLADYPFKSPSNDGGHHIAGKSLEVIMDKFSINASPNCRNFVSDSKSSGRV